MAKKSTIRHNGANKTMPSNAGATLNGGAHHGANAKMPNVKAGAMMNGCAHKGANK